MKFTTIPKAIEEIRRGKPLIILDDERECEADFYAPAQVITPELIMMMIRFGGGILLAALTQTQVNRLGIPLMVPLKGNTEATGLNLTISVNAKDGITTGVSAFDRTKTISLLAKPDVKPESFTRPGHVSCAVANPGGLSRRQGHTEAAVDLAVRAGFYPAGVLCEILQENGKMAQISELEKLSVKLEVSVVLLRDIVNYAKQYPLPVKSETGITKTAQAKLPTQYGLFNIIVYNSFIDNHEHTVLSMGDITNQPTVARIHSQCLTGDTLLSLRCDCREQLHQSMQKIANNGSGIILYLNQEGRGIGLAKKIKAYALQEQGLDTIEANHALGFAADERDYKIAADIFKHLGIKQISLLTNNPDKVKQLTKYGTNVVKRIPLNTKPNTFNQKYLQTKIQKLEHLL